LGSIDDREEEVEEADDETVDDLVCFEEVAEV
jgi:hypothetical protein